MAFDLTAARPEIATQVPHLPLQTHPTFLLFFLSLSPLMVCRPGVVVLSLTVPAVQCTLRTRDPRTALGRHVLTHR